MVCSPKAGAQFVSFHSNKEYEEWGGDHWETFHTGPSFMRNGELLKSLNRPSQLDLDSWEDGLSSVMWEDWWWTDRQTDRGNHHGISGRQRRLERGGTAGMGKKDRMPLCIEET